MDSTDIKSFLTVARTGSVTMASIAMNTTQSALSKRIKNLESEVGFDLFLRGKGQKGVELTSAGVDFMELAQRWQGLLQDMQNLHVMERSQALRIGVLDSVQPLTTRLALNLLKKNNDIRLRLQTCSSEVAYNELDKRALDVAFSNMERQMPSVRRQLLFSEPFVVLCPRDDAQDTEHTARQTLHVRDLDPDTEVFTRWWSPGFLAWHENHWPALRSQRLSVSSVHLQLTFLGMQGRWAIMPYSLAREACATRACVMYRLEPEPPQRVCHLLTHKQPRASARQVMELFMDCLYETIRNDLPWLKLLSGKQAASGG